MNRRQPQALAYFWQCKPGEQSTRLHRNQMVVFDDELDKLDSDDYLGIWSYKNAHVLEGRDPNSISGIWPINGCRAFKAYGTLPISMHADLADAKAVTPEQAKYAKHFRLFAYRKITSVDEAILRLQNLVPFSFSCEINEEWFDPRLGLIPTLQENSRFVSTHSVTILEYNPERQLFLFSNSWGEVWGYNGYGFMPMSNFDKSIVAADEISLVSAGIPKINSAGIMLRGWKTRERHGDGIYGIEVVDCDDDEYLAWTFCVARDCYLDIEEFFVRPDSRGRGYAKLIADQLLKLSAKAKLPLRAIIDFADTEPYAIDGAKAVTRLLGLNFVEADVRWASHFGLKDAPPRPSRNWRPGRAESILEKLRPISQPALEQPTQYTVFFGTNRKPNVSDDFSKGFSSDRDTRLHRGRCLVEIPACHQQGAAGRRWLDNLKRAASNKKRMVLTEALDKESFWNWAQLLTTKFENEKANLLFIHGFKNSFNDAAFRAAQLGVDLRLNGATFFYSWPCINSVPGYAADECTIETCVETCRLFVKEILESQPHVPLHILSHSMGNRLAVAVLEELAREPQRCGSIGEFVLAAADIDVDRFKQAVPRIKPIVKGITAYTSAGDFALHLSESLHKFPRLGLAPPVTCIEGVHTVLAHGFSTLELFGHDYVTEASPLISDLYALLKYNTRPEERLRLKQVPDEASGLHYWSLPVGM